MTPDEYIAQRLDDQIDWYDRKSIQNQRSFKRIRLLEIILAAAIPLIVPYASEQTWIAVAVGVCGFLVAVLAGVLTMQRFQENWIQYRTTCESLRHEKIMYLTRCGPYASEQRFQTLVTRAESIISAENTDWRTRISITEDADRQPEQAPTQLT